jgi:hypothetical protein
MIHSDAKRRLDVSSSLEHLPEMQEVCSLSLTKDHLFLVTRHVRDQAVSILLISNADLEKTKPEFIHSTSKIILQCLFFLICLVDD